MEEADYKALLQKARQFLEIDEVTLADLRSVVDAVLWHWPPSSRGPVPTETDMAGRLERVLAVVRVLCWGRPQAPDWALLRRRLALEELPLDFMKFFEAAEGPFGSEFLPFELADIAEGDSVVSLTLEAREHLALPDRYLVLGPLMTAGGLVVMDSRTGGVFVTHTEGGIELLQAGECPRWSSFLAMLHEFFRGPAIVA